MAIDNGRRTEAAFANIKGEVVTANAGLSERDGTISIAFAGDARQFRLPLTGTLEGAPVEVLTIQRSQFVTDPKMVVMTVARLPAIETEN